MMLEHTDKTEWYVSLMRYDYLCLADPSVKLSSLRVTGRIGEQHRLDDVRPPLRAGRPGATAAAATHPAVRMLALLEEPSEAARPPAPGRRAPGPRGPRGRIGSSRGGGRGGQPQQSAEREGGARAGGDDGADDNVLGGDAVLQIVDDIDDGGIEEELGAEAMLLEATAARAIEAAKAGLDTAAEPETGGAATTAPEQAAAFPELQVAGSQTTNMHWQWLGNGNTNN